MIASISTGFSNIDLEECKARETEVSNSPGLNSGNVETYSATAVERARRDLHECAGVEPPWTRSALPEKKTA